MTKPAELPAHVREKKKACNARKKAYYALKKKFRSAPVVVNGITVEKGSSGASEIVAAGIRARHRRNQAAQASLSDAMQRWDGMRLAAGDDDTAMQARFLYRFGTDVMSAQGLSERAALELRDEINAALG